MKMGRSGKTAGVASGIEWQRVQPVVRTHNALRIRLVRLLDIPFTNSIPTLPPPEVEMHVCLMVAVRTWTEHSRKCLADTLAQFFSQGLRFGCTGEH